VVNPKLLMNSNVGTRVYIRDPIDRGSVLRNDSRDAIFEWCEENCQGKYWVGMGFGQFELEDDVTLFKLRWL
jgi:hypothetical protein